MCTVIGTVQCIRLDVPRIDKVASFAKPQLTSAVVPKSTPELDIKQQAEALDDYK